MAEERRFSPSTTLRFCWRLKYVCRAVLARLPFLFIFPRVACADFVFTVDWYAVAWDNIGFVPGGFRILSAGAWCDSVALHARGFEIKLNFTLTPPLMAYVSDVVFCRRCRLSCSADLADYTR